MEMSAPHTIGRYEIVRRLSKSMTDVYLAIDTVGNRKTALKLVKCGGDAANRLVLEAERRGAAIQKEMSALDPRVVEIYDFGEADGYFYVAMQYVEGRNLAEVLEAETAIDPLRAAAIALELCEQLAKFHSWRLAVVHGDIKPSNIHLGPNDTVRLLDFGIAKTLRADADATVHNFGSPSYCSPERLARSEVDQQSDLWAVGATLYEMLAGVPPYRAEDTRKLQNLIRSRRPPRALPARCPRALRDVVSKALAPNPAERYRSAREFQEDLQAFLERKPTLAEMERRPGWSANATLDAARAYLRKATATIARVRRPLRPLRVAGAVAWFAAGMALWIGGDFAWRQLQAHRVAEAAEAPAPAPPASEPAPLALAAMYVSAADRILDAYRTSGNPELNDFDWQKAEVCLQRSVELGSGEDQTLGKLALARGYAALERLAGGRYSEASGKQMGLYIRGQFEAAASKMPRSPDPPLALARLHVYSLPDPDLASAEFAAAEQLGASLGRREIEQQGDAYRLRAERRRRADPRAAWHDAQKARAFYRRIPDYNRTAESLRLLQTIREPRPVKQLASHRRSPRWR
jgi:eukaryotic-like serine/threonine-protein kinase